MFWSTVSFGTSRLINNVFFHCFNRLEARKYASLDLPVLEYAVMRVTVQGSTHHQIISSSSGINVLVCTLYELEYTLSISSKAIDCIEYALFHSHARILSISSLSDMSL